MACVAPLRPQRRRRRPRLGARRADHLARRRAQNRPRQPCAPSARAHSAASRSGTARAARQRVGAAQRRRSCVGAAAAARGQAAPASGAPLCTLFRALGHQGWVGGARGRNAAHEALATAQWTARSARNRPGSAASGASALPRAAPVQLAERRALPGAVTYRPSAFAPASSAAQPCRRRSAARWAACRSSMPRRRVSACAAAAARRAFAPPRTTAPARVLRRLRRAPRCSSSPPGRRQANAGSSFCEAQLTRVAQVMHSLTSERLEVVRDLDHFAATEVRARRRGGPPRRRPRPLLGPTCRAGAR